MLKPGWRAWQSCSEARRTRLSRRMMPGMSCRAQVQANSMWCVVAIALCSVVQLWFGPGDTCCAATCRDNVELALSQRPPPLQGPLQLILPRDHSAFSRFRFRGPDSSTSEVSQHSPFVSSILDSIHRHHVFLPQITPRETRVQLERKVASQQSAQPVWPRALSCMIPSPGVRGGGHTSASGTVSALRLSLGLVLPCILWSGKYLFEPLGT